MSDRKSKPLKLLAQDVEDINVVAAVLQDAIAPVSDMLYRPDDKNFIMVVHRFCWNCGDEPVAGPAADCCFERVCCALNIRGVTGVKLQGFQQDKQGLMLDLLTISHDADCLTFTFAGGARLQLSLSGWLMMVEDFGEAWPTQRQPCHAT